MCFIVVCTLADNEYVSLFVSQAFFFVLFLHIKRVCYHDGLTIMIVFFLIQPLLLVQVRLKHDLFQKWPPSL